MADDAKAPDAKVAEAKPKEEKWWHWILWGLVSLALAAYLYYDLTKFEQEGGTRRMKAILAFAYNIAGKWGVVGLVSLMGIGLIGLGVWQKTSKKT